jgi:two-component system, chemotaxis family, chemotaxis protein CheY
MPSCLVVDASHVARTVARNILEELGFTVDEAATGLAALEAYRTNRPALLLLEWDLPDMSGLKLLRLLRSEVDGPAPDIVFCTRRDGAAEMTDAVREGATEFVVKPYDNETLRARLAMAGYGS